MKTYIKFLTSIFLKSFLNVLIIIFSLVVLINLLTEIEFFSDLDVNIFSTSFIVIEFALNDF